MQTDSAFGGEPAQPTTRFLLSILRTAAILGILAAIAGFWGETHWIADLLAQLRVQWAIGLLVLVLLFALARRWWWMLLCVIGLAINAIPIWPYVTSSAGFSNSAVAVAAKSNDTPKDHLRLMSLNLLTKNRNWDGVIESVLDTSPDFLVLMEIDSVWQQVCQAKLAQNYPHTIFEPREDNFGIAFFSKFPFDRSTVFNSETLELPSIDVTISKSGAKPLRIVSTHPIPPMDQLRWKARNEQLVNVAARFDGSTANLMVGDFNLTPWSPCFKKVLGTNLRDASQSFGLTPTWYVFPTWIGGLKIDHALVSEEISVQKLEIGQDVGSDHRALILDFSF